MRRSTCGPVRFNPIFYLQMLNICLVFTKCKEALPNGARLENITWRLWHRELRGHGRVKNAQTTKECEPVGATGLEKSSYRPPTPSAVPRIASGMSFLSPHHVLLLESSGIPITIPYASSRSSSSNYVITSRYCSSLLRSTLSSVLFPLASTLLPHSIIVRE